MPQPRTLLYLIRRDIRLSDNPVFHEVVSAFAESNCKFTHLLPLYVFQADQVETSGFLTKEAQNDHPFPPARSRIGGFWRCGPHRAKFLAESIIDLQDSLRKIGSDLSMQAGSPETIIERILHGTSSLGSPDGSSDRSFSSSEAGGEVIEVWMTEEKTIEEKRDEKRIQRIVEKKGLKLRLFKDEKYFLDE
jgi:deoxyribodipyrimidine photo-lyase